MDALDGNVKFGMLGVLFYILKKKSLNKQLYHVCNHGFGFEFFSRVGK